MYHSTYNEKQSHKTTMNWGATWVFLFSFPTATFPGSPHYLGLTITLRHATLGNTSLVQ